MTPNEIDVALMLRIKAGDEDAFRELIERHQRAVISVIYRALGDAWESEDLAQRVFIQVFRSARRYQPTAKFTTWLYTITHNAIRNEYRRRARHAAESFDALTQPGETGEPGAQLADPQAIDPGQLVIERELQEQIQTAVQLLPETQRTAVILCRFEGLPYEEIATVLNCSVSAVKSLLHRARETLKEKLRGCY